MLWVLICTVHLTVCYYHVAYKFQSECTLCILHECQGAPGLKQVPYLKFKWQRRDSNPQPPSSETNTQPFSQTDQIIELCCEHLSVRCIWLYVIVMSRMSLRLNLHSIVCLNVKELLARSKRHIWSLNDNKIQTHNNLVCKWTLNHLAKLAKWLSCVVSTYLCNAIVCTPPPPFCRGGGLSLWPNFQKGRGLDRISVFRGALLGKRGWFSSFFYFEGGGVVVFM